MEKRLSGRSSAIVRSRSELRVLPWNGWFARSRIRIHARPPVTMRTKDIPAGIEGPNRAAYRTRTILTTLSSAPERARTK